MKTAMLELMQWMEETEFMVNVGFIEKVNELLEKEKEQIIKAFNDGHHADVGHIDKAWEYYNQTYNQKQHIIDIMKADEDDGLYNQNK
jgi:hypothetical protein